MKAQFDRNIVYLVLATILAVNAFYATAGVREGGGGDLCEDRIKIIRDDLKDWITRGGPNGLALPQGESSGLYSQSMLNKIGSAKIKCVGHGDQGYPVKIGKTPKVCRFDSDQHQDQITCDYKKFLATNESDQYILVHHEYAGLAGIELPNADDSNYPISNQITGFLVEKVEKKLAVKPGLSIMDQILRASNFGPYHRSVLYIELSNFNPHLGNDPSNPFNNGDGFYSSARDSIDTFGQPGYSTLKEAITGLATRLDIVELQVDSPLPDSIEYKQLYLNEFRTLLYAPELALGLSDDDIDQMDLVFTTKKAAGKEVFLSIGMEDGKIVVKDGLWFDGSATIASGKTFSEALKAATAVLRN